MSAFPVVVQNSLGRTFHLTRQIGKGGEGAVYETREQSDIALKLYWPNKAQSRRDKIAAMASAQWYKTNSFVAFPIDVLFSPTGAFVGFAMRKVGGNKPVHMLYSPASRKVEFAKADYRFLVRAAANIARAVASVHAIGCVIGDINHSGFLISEKATSTLIDSDSFQIVAANSKFLCQVGTPEYTPPELQGARFDRVTRTPNHDNFGLAVLIFQILFMGRHPFSGVYQLSGDMPLERAIGEHRFAYSSQASTTKMLPPPGAPLLTDFPADIGQAFENAFSRSDRNLRKNAAEWVSLLGALEKVLIQCAANASHQHVSGKSCPWCRLEQSSPGFVTFNHSNFTIDIPSYIDVSQVSAVINGIRNPGPTPDLQAVIFVPTTPNPIAPTGRLISDLKLRAYIGIGASAVGAILIFLGGVVTVPGLIALGGGLLASILVPKELNRLRQARSQAETSWRSIKEAWVKQPGDVKFLEAKKEANELIRSLADLPNEQSRQIKILEQKKRDVQLNRYLERFIIAHAKISKIGSGRKAVLASFGVETAADVNEQKLSTIQGFGPTLIAALMAWRESVAKRFVFNASEPINQNNLIALKTRIANRRAQLENKIRASATALHQASHFSLSQRTTLSNLANQAFAACKQAEANEQLAAGPLHKASKFISLCCAGLAAIRLIKNSDTINLRTPKSSSVVTTVAPEQQPIPNPARSTANVPPEIRRESQPVNAPPLDLLSVNQQPANKVASSDETQAPPFPPGKEISQVPIGGAEQPISLPATRNLSEKEVAIRVQQRLIELGFLRGAADGKWGPKSKQAFARYKEQAGLDKNDTWDVATERSLFSDNAQRANDTLSFVGGWSFEAGQCGEPDRPPPIRITAERAETDSGVCEFNSVRPDGSGAWRIDAKCSAGRESHAAHIRLAVKGSVLEWTSEQPQTLYYRCEKSR
jgi:DNA-binding helix-hairpin-helix protein with protein kinase domain